MKAAVVGAGIGGLAVAGGLRRAGADVVVLERSPAMSTGGVALSLFDNGLRALDVVGAGDDARRIGQPPGPTTAGLRDGRGRWLSRFGPAVVPSGRIFGRRALHEVLTAPVADVVRYDSRVTSATRGTVHLVGGDLDGFDVVVAADGVRSAVRSAWPDDPGVTFSGYHAWRGLTSGPVATTGVGEVWGRGRRFGIAPLSDGRIYWFATINAPRDASPAPTAEAVRAAFAGWPADVRAVLAAAEDVSCLPIDELVPGAPTFARDGVALLGDAAHAMTPNLGQGANQALEDAAHLTRLLAPLARAHPEPRDVDTALDAYDRIRRPRALRIAAQSRRVGRAGQLENRLAVRARDTLMRAVPDRLTGAAPLHLQRGAGL